MLAEALGTWPVIVRTRVRGKEWQKKEDWNTGEELREILNI